MYRAWSFLVLIAFFGCGDDASVDAGGGEDVAEDTSEGDVGTDAGPLCSGECTSTEGCCLIDGEMMCVDTRSNPDHCGVCGRECVAEGRGDSCAFGVCVCGNIAQGCAGDGSHLCCPARTPAGTNYCANLQLDPEDCGTCGERCDIAQADSCDGGQCRCGDSRDACAGTPESTCCRAEIGDTECIDTTVDPLHCGGCNNACMLGEYCADGSCTVGETTCEEPCIPGQVCCGGSCCLRNFCLDDAMCTESK